MNRTHHITLIRHEHQPRNTTVHGITCVFTCLILLCSTALAQAGTMLLRGDMDSLINFEIEKTIQAADASRTFYLSFVVPKSYTSPTFSQVVTDFALTFTPAPASRITRTDKRGNEVVEARWDTPPHTIRARITFNAANTTTLRTLRSDAPFPVAPVSGELRDYLMGTAQVQTNDPRIIRLARKLTEGATTQYEAVERISAWVVDNVRYVNPPKQFDAAYSVTSGLGNCQNYSHLAAALLRVLGIPVRIINGITLDEPFDIALSAGVMRSRMGLGRHSWIEVWFPDLGWTPFNPQNTAMFIANRFIRVEVGLDNKEAVNDGKLKWVPVPGTRRPAALEAITADFGRDTVTLAGNELRNGPRQRLMLPVVEATAAGAPADAVASSVKKDRPDKATASPVTPGSKTGKTTSKATPPPASSGPQPAPGKQRTDAPAPKPKKPAQQHAAKPDTPAPKTTPAARPAHEPASRPHPGTLPAGALLVHGNLEFPENVDFATFSDAPVTENGVMTVTRNFMVETAEYVTSRMQQYAQAFEITQSIALRDISLALHRYGGGGVLWIDLMQDAGGKPGNLVATSNLIPVSSISLRPGYRWTNFTFAQNGATLAPGRYWIGLGYTGDPIINWFFTYGKPVGPQDGTRFRDALVANWGGALSYEFNYRVRGVVR